MQLIGVEPFHLETILRILRQYLPGYEVRAFGSRVHGRTVRKFSDLDLAVMTEEPLDALLLAEVKDAFTESDLPFKVDLLDWAVTGTGFKAIVEKENVILQEGKK